DRSRDWLVRRKIILELVTHGCGHRMRLELAVRVAGDPHALFRALDACFAVQAQQVLHVEAGMAEREGALDRHIIPKSRWPQEARPRAQQRETTELKFIEHFELGQSELALE